jgi:iron-sulfur cluster repair protein YtfE (RIC family)
VANVGDLLKQDHREVETLFAEFDRSGGRGIALKICDKFDRHASVEEQIVYPALREGVSGGRALADDARQQHSQARHLIFQIRQTTEDEHVAVFVGELKDAIEHHISEEERTVIPKMDSDLGLLEMDVLGAQVEELGISG